MEINNDGFASLLPIDKHDNLICTIVQHFDGLTFDEVTTILDSVKIRIQRTVKLSIPPQGINE